MSDDNFKQDIEEAILDSTPDIWVNDRKIHYDIGVDSPREEIQIGDDLSKKTKITISHFLSRQTSGKNLSQRKNIFPISDEYKEKWENIVSEERVGSNSLYIWNKYVKYAGKSDLLTIRKKLLENILSDIEGGN